MVGTELNLRADITPLVAGMPPSAVNTVGGVIGDHAQRYQFFSPPFLPVGFTTKPFITSDCFVLERLIRNVTGLGKVDVSTPHIRTPKL